MHLKRKLAVIAGLAPLLVFTLPAATANAHGYVSSPASRQAQCAQGIVACGNIKYEPQSVEGPKGLRSCHANLGQFAELSDDNKGWRVHNVGSSASFTWTFTARHRTANYEYYIGNTRVGFEDGGNAQPPATVTHNVNFGGFSGRQKLLAIWNIGDTVNAFYACIDLNIGGGGNPNPPTTQPPTTTPPTTTTPPPAGGTWAANTAYSVGQTVTYGGSSYRCRQAHTSLPGWEPPNAAALWEKI
jgi:predicted carbohydrate-binding protein with CBM5 and CBM33 domain